jgi:hypothetical protein
MFAPENTLVAPQHCPAGQLRNSAAAMALSLWAVRGVKRRSVWHRSSRRDSAHFRSSRLQGTSNPPKKPVDALASRRGTQPAGSGVEAFEVP